MTIPFVFAIFATALHVLCAAGRTNIDVTINSRGINDPPTDEYPIGKAGVFDDYIFARFFEPDRYKCGTHGGSGNLTLHGLWPQYIKAVFNPMTGKQDQFWPQFCNMSNPKFWNEVRSIEKIVEANFSAKWAVWAPSYLTGLGLHEWAKHGTCAFHSIYAAAADHTNAHDAVAAIQTRYFTIQERLMMEYPTPQGLISARQHGQALSVATLQRMFLGDGPTKSVTLSCRRNPDRDNRIELEMVSFCFDKETKDQGVGAMRPCDDDVWYSDYTNGCVVTYGLDAKVHLDAPCL